jgi:hypothetical protein
MNLLQNFESLVRGTLSKCREVTSWEVLPGFQVRVTLDYSKLNSQIENRLSQTERLWKSYYSQAGMCIIPLNDVVTTSFPYESPEARLTGTPCIVSTLYDS